MTRVAKVENVNDPDKLGRFQVRILPDMISFSAEDLPWATSYNIGNGISENVGVHKVPEVGTFIRVLIEDWPLLKRIRYVSDDYVEGLYIYDEANSLDGIGELTEQEYPQPAFKKFKDGTVEFHNSETGEHGVFFGDGSYMLKTEDGSFISNSRAYGQKIYNDSGYIELLASGKVALCGDSKNLVTHKELDDALQLLLNALNLHAHLGVTTGSGTSGAVSSPLTLDISQSKASNILTI